MICVCKTVCHTVMIASEVNDLIIIIIGESSIV